MLVQLGRKLLIKMCWYFRENNTKLAVKVSSNALRSTLGANDPVACSETDAAAPVV
jgi:ribosomal protein L28